MSALTVKGIEIPPRITVAERQLELNGVGIKSKFFVEAYVACLYLLDKSEDAEEIISADRPQAIILHITSSRVTNERLVSGTLEAMVKASDDGLAPIQAQVDRFLGLLEQEVSKGDMFELAYVPGSGTSVSMNGKRLGVVEGMPFKKALFGIWLSDRPTQKSLKKQLLSAL
ncbi:MAG: chalcone isomerase family protein [Wenzhouxiangellaceae bacterium]|nr:chalcone isomerase family protein [Wenzhouxiangellaceae bacterium]